MDPAVYARGVVDNALKETSELWYWRGAKIWVVWAMTTLLWHRFPVSSPIVFHLCCFFFCFETEQGLKDLLMVCSGFHILAIEWID